MDRGQAIMLGSFAWFESRQGGQGLEGKEVRNPVYFYLLRESN
jgi:hypothetical protein